MKNKGLIIKTVSIALAAVLLSTNFASAGERVIKDESVYVNLSSSGNAIDVTVSDWLHRDNVNADIKDKSILKDIKNIKGEETPSKDKDSLIWKSDKNDIYYQGKTDKNLPLEVNITYTFNGKKVEPSDLAGKSGRLGIRLEYKNKDSHVVYIDGRVKTIYTPIVAAAVVNLPIDTFKNVNINSGEIVSDGNNQVVTFIAIPGLKESLGIGSLIDLPEVLEINCDVENFKMGPIMITATPSIPEIKKIKDVGSINELIDGIDKIKDASKKLSEGTGLIAQNQMALANGIGDLKNGMHELDDASLKLLDGASSLGNGVKQYGLGAAEYASKAKEFSDGAAKVSVGSKTIADKTGELYGGLDTIVKSTGKLIEGQKKVTAGADQAIEGVEKLKIGKQREINAFDMLLGGVSILKGLVENLAVIPGADAIANGLSEGLKKQEETLLALKESGSDYIKGLDDLENGLKEIKEGSLALDTGLNSLQGGQRLAAEGAKQIALGGQSMGPALEQLQAGSSGLKGGADKLNGAALGLNNGAEGFITGASKFGAGVKSASKGADTLYSGAIKLSDGSKELDLNMKKFENDGIDKMSSKVNESIGDVQDLIKTKDELIKLSDSYGTFSGIGEVAIGKVRFIMKTEEIKAPEVKNEKKDVVNNSKSKGFIQWLKKIFTK